MRNGCEKFNNGVKNGFEKETIEKMEGVYY